MVRSSVSPDNLSQVSFTGASATPELPEEEEEEGEVSEEKMQGNYSTEFLLHSYKALLQKHIKSHKFYKSSNGGVDTVLFFSSLLMVHE